MSVFYISLSSWDYKNDLNLSWIYYSFYFIPLYLCFDWILRVFFFLVVFPVFFPQIEWGYYVLNIFLTFPIGLLPFSVACSQSSLFFIHALQQIRILACNIKELTRSMPFPWLWVISDFRVYVVWLNITGYLFILSRIQWRYWEFQSIILIHSQYYWEFPPQWVTLNYLL